MARQVRAAAARRLARQDALRSLELLGEPVVGADPAAQVLEQIAYAAGHVRWLRDRVRGLDPAVPVDDGPPWLGMYHDERERLVKWSDIAVRLGIEQRRVALAEQLGGLVVDLLRGVLDQLELTAEQHRVVAEVLPGRLRQLTAGLVDGGPG